MIALTELAAQIRAIALAEMMPRWRQTAVQLKADGSCLTAADLAVQQRIIALLHSIDPAIPVLSEELPAEVQQQLLADAINTGQSLWCLDPLDGTSNYAGGFPGFAVSLARVTAGQIDYGLVFDPVRDECFTAQLGQGAWCNEQPLAPFALSNQLADALAMIDVKRLPPAQLTALFTQPAFRSQRSLGSVALEWCWLAAGRYQVYLHGSQRLWDYAAGRLIATEAGACSALYAHDQPLTAATAMSLTPHMAIAAVNAELFAQWQTIVDWPWRDY